MTKECLKGTQLTMATIGVSLGTFIQVLDSSIANVSIPYIAGDLAASPDEGTWVITSFSVTNAIVLPLTGWLAKRFGEVKTFVWSVIWFSIISWLCGLAWSLPMLITLRVMQGAAAGSLIPLSQSLLLQNYPEEKRGMALGLWSMVVITAPLIGPVLGGWITYNYSWPWIFYINVPIGFISAFLTWKTLSGRENPTQKIPVDVIGFALLIVGVGCLQIMLDRGQEEDWWRSNQIIILTILSIIGLTFFIGWNANSRYPVVDFSFFKNRNFLVGCILGALGFFLFFGGVVVAPLWLQLKQGYTATWAGISVAPFGIFPVLLSGFIGRLVSRIDPRIMLTGSFMVLSLSCFWMSTFTTQVSLYQLILPRLLQGLGLAFFFIPVVTITLSEISSKNLSSASGIFNFMRILVGAGFGTSLFVTVWERREIFHHARVGEFVNIYSENTLAAVAALRAHGFTGDKAYGALDYTLSLQASMLSINDVWWLSGWVYILLIPLVWLCHPVKVMGPKIAAVE